MYFYDNNIYFQRHILECGIICKKLSNGRGEYAMGMSIYNNFAAMSALHENNRNEKNLSKILKQAASGMKINFAGDDASGYAISEKMRIKLRALDQNDRNVKNGSSMLKVASGAVQEQTNLLKTIKQKVIDASNDTNNDHDREVIQKEIDQYYSQMQDIVYDTEFNGEKILMGNAVSEVVSSWEKKDIPTLADDSEIPGLLPDANEASLDGQQGPFATFGKSTDDVPYDGYNQKIESPAKWSESSVSNTNGDYLVGGTRGTPNTIDIDLSGYPFSAADKSSLSDKTFSLTLPNPWSTGGYTWNFTLTTDTSKQYNDSYTIDISGCSSTADVAMAIQDAIKNKNAYIRDTYSVTVSGSKVTLETKKDAAITNNDTYYNVSGTSLNGSQATVDRQEAPATGLAKGKFTGGKDAVTHLELVPDPLPNDPDHKKWDTVEDQPATKATLQIPNITSVAPGSGITVNNYSPNWGISTTYLRFKDDDSGFQYDSTSGHWTVGRNYKGTFTISAGMKITMENGNLTAETSETGVVAEQNSSIIDGIPKHETTAYTATTALKGINNNKTGEDGKTAHWDIDLSAYTSSSVTMAEDLINKYKGKTLEIPVKDEKGNDATRQYEFIDTGSTDGMDGVQKITENTIDLNTVRNEVKNGKTVAEAFATVVSGLINSKNPSTIKGITFPDRTELIKTNGTTVTGLRINATEIGEIGNTQKVGSQTGELRHYTIDWQNWVNTQGITDIPAALHEKGIRFYCPTDSSQWVNMRFVNGTNDLDADRPDSGDADNDIKTLTIDLSGADSVEKLVETIDKQLGDYLDNTYNHVFRVTSDPKTGTTTIYDPRCWKVLDDNTYDNQEKGAKIGTGIMDNVVKASRNIYVNDLVIQHTDKANMNIHVKIPQTSMDQIFGFKEGTRHISEYNVLTQDMREKLLGVPPDKGILDRGIDYLLDAQTSIGAQINHMYHADDNIVTQHENTTSAESVILDADMAKTMMSYAKYNILSQGSQSMLAQANQTPQSVLSLLQ